MGFLEKVNKTVKTAGINLKKHSPTILVVVGVAGVVTSTVLACRATTKIDGILSKTKDTVDMIKRTQEDEELRQSGEYTEEDAKKDLTITYTKTAISLVKLYAPSVILGTLSLGSIIASHHILNKRNVALTSAYLLVDKSFKDYRGRVKERFGERVDYELRHNVKAEEIKVVTADENGKQTVETKTVDTVNSNQDQYSSYAKFFDEYSPYWDKDPEYNLMFLKQQQSYANDKLKANGYLFLNEVYEMLGIPKTKAGQVVGWVYDKNCEDSTADGFVDFGITDVYKKGVREFVNGYERSILLDFNVDGPILELLK